MLTLFHGFAFATLAMAPPADPTDPRGRPDEQAVPAPADAPAATPSEPRDDGPTPSASATEPSGPVTYRERYMSPPAEAAVARQSRVNLSGGPRRKGSFQRKGSPQRFAMELKGGPYRPDVDKNYDPSQCDAALASPGSCEYGPYTNIFGRIDKETGVANGPPKLAPMFYLGFEWQFAYLAGPFGLGVQAGFFRDKAKALLANPTQENARKTGDSATFALVPISLLVSYRLEILADRFNVPVIPYGKAGPSYAFWRAKAGGRVPENDAGEKGRGGVWGYQVNAGVMLRLDFLDRGSAKSLDVATGINHTFLFGEFQLARLDGFGAKRSMNVGDSTFFGGLGVEF